MPDGFIFQQDGVPAHRACNARLELIAYATAVTLLWSMNGHQTRQILICLISMCGVPCWEPITSWTSSISNQQLRIDSNKTEDDVECKAYLSVQLMLICAVVNWKCAVVICSLCSSNYSFLCSFPGVEYLQKFAAVAPMQNATRRAQEMHFKYKNVTSFKELRTLTPWPGALSPGPSYRLALRTRHGPLRTQLLIVQH